MKQMSVKTKMAIVRAKRSAMGRMFCRLLGDQTGGVMMEYVILAVMIAAAVTLAVIFFGDQIAGGFDVMRKAITGKTSDAEKAAKANQDELAGQATDSEASRKAIAPGAK